MDEAKLYWARKDVPGTFELISNTKELAQYFKLAQDDGKVADMVVSENNTYLVLYMQSSFLYPANDNITCLDWNHILNRPPAPAAAATVPPDVVTNAARMANDLGKIAVSASEEANLKKLRNAPLNYTDFPTEAKKQFLRRQRKVPIR